MTPSALVLLNGRARAGTAARRYDQVRPLLERSFKLDTVALDNRGVWRDEVTRALRSGVTMFIAAGGDGTVSALAGTLLESEVGVPSASLCLGAIGLGSSNDFHKPFTENATGVPMRLEMTKARVVRPIQVRIVAADGSRMTRYAMVSASIGLVARGNERFNNAGPFLQALKRRWVGGAVAWAALAALARRVPVSGVLRMDGEPVSGVFANVSVARTPHLAGALAYDTPVDPTGEALSVNVCGAMHRVELVRALVSLARGRLSSRPKTLHRWAKNVAFSSDDAFDLEIDGETLRATTAAFDLAKEGLQLCSA